METSTDSTTGSIIKSDRTGRTRYSSQYKRKVLEAFESSSLSAPAFAQQCGVKCPTFAAWVARRKRTGWLDPSSAPAFILAELPGSSESSGLEVRLPGGALARASDPTRLNSSSSPNSSATSPEAHRHAHLQRQPQGLRRA